MKVTVVPSPHPQARLQQEKGEKCGLNKAQNPAISAIGIFLMNLRFQRCTPCSDKTTYSTKKVTKRSFWIPGKSELSPTTSSKYTWTIELRAKKKDQNPRPIRKQMKACPPHRNSPVSLNSGWFNSSTWQMFWDHMDSNPVPQRFWWWKYQSKSWKMCLCLFSNG